MSHDTSAVSPERQYVSATFRGQSYVVVRVIPRDPPEEETRTDR